MITRMAVGQTGFPVHEFVGKLVEMDFHVTQDEVDIYLENSGDDNPIHYNADFAKDTIFGRPIVPGGLVAAMVSPMVLKAVGYGWVLDRIIAKPKRAMFVGDKLKAKLQIVDYEAGRLPKIRAYIVVYRCNNGVKDKEVLWCEVWCINAVILRPAAAEPAAAAEVAAS